MARFPARPTEGPCERSGESPDEVMCEGTGARSPAPDEGTRNPSHTPFVTRDRGPEGRRTSVARKGANRESDRRVTRVARFRSVASRRAVKRVKWPKAGRDTTPTEATERPRVGRVEGQGKERPADRTVSLSLRPAGGSDAERRRDERSENRRSVVRRHRAGSRRRRKARGTGEDDTSRPWHGVGGREASRVARHAGGGDQAEGRVEHRGRRQTEDDGDRGPVGRTTHERRTEGMR